YERSNMAAGLAILAEAPRSPAFFLRHPDHSRSLNGPPKLSEGQSFRRPAVSPKLPEQCLRGRHPTRPTIIAATSRAGMSLCVRDLHRDRGAGVRSGSAVNAPSRAPPDRDHGSLPPPPPRFGMQMSSHGSVSSPPLSQISVTSPTPMP